ncbi:MAG: carotenoid biosynthesis protein [Nitrospirales bacterium]|nr:carotenoid biosynthesis protein [Nitrospirales bacterium]
MEIFYLLFKTLVFRPYVFVFLGISLFAAQKLLGWSRTARFFGLTWTVAFLCEYSSTRIGIPFGNYFYTGSTVEEELYFSNIPLMDSLSFCFLLFASYSLALAFALPPAAHKGARVAWAFDPASRISWPVVILTVLLFTFSDIVIDPVALRGDRWFLGQIYGYPYEGIYFGVPLANFAGWAVVGGISMLGYRWMEQFWYEGEPVPKSIVGLEVLWGVGLYYGILAFNLGITFWIGEIFMGLVGCLIFIPITYLLMLRWWAIWRNPRNMSADPKRRGRLESFEQECS